MRLRFILHTTLAFSSVLALAAAAFVVLFPVMPDRDFATVEAAEETKIEKPLPMVAGAQEILQMPSLTGSATSTVFIENVTRLGTPMTEAASRVTKKPFGIHIDPEHSPVPNDRFTGFHVGTDFEVFASEMETETPVFVICPGPLRMKKFAKGYGGVAVQECKLDGRVVTVIYGHLNLESIGPEIGTTLGVGERLGSLGKDHSEETDGVRKHLHLGVREGRFLPEDPEAKIDIRGYVKEDKDIPLYLDAVEHMDLPETF